MVVRGNIGIRPPCRRDGGKLMTLVRASGALDANSSYLYYLFADHFSATCAYAEAGDVAAGFVTAYRLPEDPACLFVWQVTVAPDFRGLGLGLALLQNLAERPWFAQIQRVCCTISPSNQASRRLFSKWGKLLGGTWREEPYLAASELGPAHEDEPLLTLDMRREG
ncbi:MAG: diaminobutyrate acetyltransferase [Kiritimatiellia bacterium]